VGGLEELEYRADNVWGQGQGWHALLRPHRAQDLMQALYVKSKADG
jgi:hypothetical protein